MTMKMSLGSNGSVISPSAMGNRNENNIGSRWKRAALLASKVGKGLSKDGKAQLLATKHWLEAIDPLHRYGENLKLYRDAWLESDSPHPFFFWLDIGHGKKIDLKECPRVRLQQQRILYLGPKEQEEYEVIVERGKLVHKNSEVLVNTTKGVKWIYVLSTSRRLFVGKKDKGVFQHSSFLSGAAIVSAGRLIASDGVPQAMWAYSGHYCPTEESMQSLIQFLDEKQVDTRYVEFSPIDDDVPPSHVSTSSQASYKISC